jgi:hypothetical protein
MAAEMLDLCILLMAYISIFYIFLYYCVCKWEIGIRTAGSCHSHNTLAGEDSRISSKRGHVTQLYARVHYVVCEARA